MKKRRKATTIFLLFFNLVNIAVFLEVTFSENRPNAAETLISSQLEQFGVCEATLLRHRKILGLMNI